MKIKLGKAYETQKKALAVLVFGLLIGTVLTTAYMPFTCEVQQQSYKESGGNVTLLATPPGTAGSVIGLIDEADTEILLSVFMLSHAGILNALEEASERGVSVRIIVDDESPVTEVKGAEVRICHFYKIYHSKFMVIDSSLILIGSHNFPGAAFKTNRELSLIYRSSELALAMKEIFESDWARSIGTS